MIKRTITCENFDGETYTDDYYFHLNKVDLMDLMAKYGGDIPEYLNKVVKNQDIEASVEFFKCIVAKAYGVKSTDGNQFIKNDAVTESFIYSNAYAELLNEIILSQEAGIAFIEGILPKQK